MQWHTPIIPSFQRLRQKDPKLKDSLMRCLNDNGPHRLTYLNIRFPVGGLLRND